MEPSRRLHDARLRLPPRADPSHVAAIYDRELAAAWMLIERIDEPPHAAGPILS